MKCQVQVTEQVPASQLYSRLIRVEDDYTGRERMARNSLRRLHGEASLHRRAHDENMDVMAFTNANTNTDTLVAWMLEKAQSLQHICDDVLSRDASTFILVQFAPHALINGVLLQNFANASNSHEEVAALAHTIHRWQVGGGPIEQNHSNLYRQLLEARNIHFPDVSSNRFVATIGLIDASWDLPTYQLSLSLFPKEYRYEIIGATLFDLAIAVPAIVRAAADERSKHVAGYVLVRDSQARETMLANAVLMMKLTAEESGSGTDSQGSANQHWMRIADGFLTSCELHKKWLNAVQENIEQSHRSPQNAMARLVERKAKFAVGYHGKLKLGDHPFDLAIQKDAESFLRDLSRSRWISPGKPEQSLLLTRLTVFGGPMFRVFSESELLVIREWIRRLPENHGESQEATRTMEKVPGAEVSRGDYSVERTVNCPVDLANAPQVRTVGSERKAIAPRKLYHQLLNIESYPEARAEALDFSLTWLARTAKRISQNDPAMLPDGYSLDGFRNWFETRALSQAESYSGGTKLVDKSRNEVIDEAVQLCPMLMIDGAWLQRWGNAGLVETSIGALLFKTLSDEIGNGETRLNHPNIYRDLMLQMGVDLPDFRREAFAFHERFDDEAFEVPAFWLSLSQFPRRFQPETLGLNLAMELSGVGGAYRTARDELRHYGFSTLFVDLHNTIDNVSSGHSAMASEAIDLFMDEIIASSDSSYIAAQWQRVRTGYRALSPPKRDWRELFVKPRYAGVHASVAM